MWCKFGHVTLKILAEMIKLWRREFEPGASLGELESALDVQIDGQFDGQIDGQREVPSRHIPFLFVQIGAVP